MAKFTVAIAAVMVLAGTGITTAAAVDGMTGASAGSLPEGGELVVVAAAMGRAGAQGGEAGSGGARHGGGGAHRGDAGGHGHRGSPHHGGEHGRHHGRHPGHHGHHHHRSHFGFGLALGAPLWWGPGYYPYSYYPPYYYGPAYEPVLIRYVERDPGYRYYCTEPAGFYPDVQSCPNTWLKVVPDGTASTSPPPGYTAPPSRR
ncbi:MAG: hypothetical protein ACR2NO_03750 [Chloroflexota bacterium]